MTEATVEQVVRPPETEQAAAAVPEIIGQPCRHYAADLLTWAEHPELEPFMRATYEAHVARSCTRRAFEPSVPDAELTEVARDKYLRHDAARLATRMLSEARNALREAQAAGDAEALAVDSFGISSAYRSALRQYRLWHNRFGGYLADTAQQRAELPGGPLGYQAAQWLAGWIGTWLAAPGFSNHNDGRAVDLYCRLASGRVLSASRADIPHWHATWLHHWLTRNAARFDFHPYEREPWHWEHRPGPATATLTEPVRPQQREAAEAEAAESVTAAGPAAYWIRHLRFGLAGNTVEPLIDGPTAFQAIQHAIESADDASHFIYLLAWWVDPWVNLTGPGTALLDLFARAGERGVQIRVLMWEPSRIREGEHLRLHEAAVDAINRLPNCHAQQDSGQAMAKSHHQKLLVVQGRGGLLALGGGVDVNADRVHDLPPPSGSYRADRPAVGWTGSSGSSGPAGAGNPLHDVHARLTGPTALPLLRMFLRRWWARSGDRAIDRRSPLRGDWLHPVPAPTGSQFVRVGETFNGVLHLPHGDVSSRQVDRAGHLAALDPGRAPVHLPGGAVPGERLRGQGDQVRDASAGPRHHPDPAVRDHRPARRLAPAPDLHRVHHGGQPGRGQAAYLHPDARPAAVSPSQRAALLCPREDGGDRRRAHAHRLGQLQQPGLGDRQRAGRGVVRGRQRTRVDGGPASGPRCGPTIWACPPARWPTRCGRGRCGTPPAAGWSAATTPAAAATARCLG